MIGKVLTIQIFFHRRLLNKKSVLNGIVTVFFRNLTVSTDLIIMIKIKIIYHFYFVGKFICLGSFLPKKGEFHI